MTETTTIPSRQQLDALQADADAAAARAAEARAELARQQSALDAQREQKRLEHIAARADSFNPAAARKAARNAHRALVAALAADPVVDAFVTWQVARLQEHRLQVQANNDATALGRDEPYRGLPDATVYELPEALRRETELLIFDRLGQWEAEVQQAFYDATLADLPERTPEEEAAYEAQQEVERRRALATPGTPSIDVSGMSPAERRRLGLPEDLPRGHVTGSRSPVPYAAGPS